MSLIQKEQRIIKFIKDFKDRTGDWPRSQDMPAVSKMLQRDFGGVVAFRTRHNLGAPDYTKGEARSEIVNRLGNEDRLKENLLFDFLVEKFGRVNIHREFFTSSDHRYRANFAIFLPNGKMVITDCFFPKDICSLKGCLNSKARKYKDRTTHPVFFVNMNDKIKSKDLAEVVLKKKTPLQPNQTAISFEDFKKLDFMV